MKFQGRKWLSERLSEIQSLTGYAVGETVDSLARRLNVDTSEIVKLNSNENFFLVKEKFRKLLYEVVNEIDPRIYPQDEESEIKKALGEYLGVSPECITIGNGSDQLLYIITRIFLDKGDEAFSINPTYSMYRICAAHQKAKYVEVPLKKDFSLDVEGVLASATSNTRLFFLANPNNPTANQFGIEEVKSVVEGIPGLVLVDEAYTNFARYSLTRLAKKHENLILLKTFSKAFGSAGLRLGFTVSNPGLAETLREKAQLPWPVSSIILRTGLKLLANIELVNESIKKLKKERVRFIGKLNDIPGVRAFDSQTNFVLFKTNEKADDVFRALLNKGIIVKNIGKILHLQGCLRTTIGLPEMNDKLIFALKQFLGE
jgi:histidinol-phosphate aminotransferase